MEVARSQNSKLSPFPAALPKQQLLDIPIKYEAFVRVRVVEFKGLVKTTAAKDGYDKMDVIVVRERERGREREKLSRPERERETRERKREGERSPKKYK